MAMKYAGKHTYMTTYMTTYMSIHEAYACSYEATAESNEGKDVVETPRQECRSCRGGSQRVIGGLGMVRGGCRRCGSWGLGCWRGAGSLRRRNGGTVSFGGLFQSVDESFHFSVDNILCTSETDADDYEGHVGDSEMSVRAFP